jgi:hypothetical protein
MKSHPFIRQDKSVLLDTNLLMVYLIALLGEGEVESYKKTSEYTTEDALILNSILKGFKNIITTPQVIAETANLLDWLHGNKQRVALGLLKLFIEQVDENYLDSKTISNSKGYLKLGITDSALFELCHNEKIVLLTADVELYGFAVGHGVEIINFNHMRNL